MKYIIFDLEWNQPSDYAATIQEPVYLTGEIVEIGAVKLDENFCPIDELRIFVRPQYYTRMHNKVASLTGIRNQVLEEQGVSFPEAYRRFLDFCGDEYAFMTWSMNDVPMLIDNMLLHGLDISNLPECYDIQRIFSREIMRGDTRYSLDTALCLMKEKGDTAHDALHDARNTAKICNHLELELYIEEYASRVFAEKPRGKKYATRRELLQDPALQEFVCPWCGTPVKCDSWISFNGSTHLAYGLCPEGDEFLVQLSVVCHNHQGYSGKRIFFEMSDDLWEIYMDKKEAVMGVHT